MNEFFSFLFNWETLENILRPEWIKYYDYMIIDENIIGGLKTSYENIQEFINQIYSKAHPASAPKLSEAQLTNEGNCF